MFSLGVVLLVMLTGAQLWSEPNVLNETFAMTYSGEQRACRVTPARTRFTRHMAVQVSFNKSWCRLAERTSSRR